MKNITPNFQPPMFQPEVTRVIKYDGICIRNKYNITRTYIGFIVFYSNRYIRVKRTLEEPLSQLLLSVASGKTYNYYLT